MADSLQVGWYLVAWRAHSPLRMANVVVAWPAAGNLNRLDDSQDSPPSLPEFNEIFLVLMFPFTLVASDLSAF